MSLMEAVRWAMREGGNRILEVLGTHRGSPPVEEQSHPGRRGSSDARPRQHAFDLAGLRRRFLSKLWRH